MRLIRTAPPIQLGEFFDNEVLNLDYAILSHRWEAEEITFQEMLEQTDETRRKKGYQKIKHFCERARADGYEFVWVDTCCINKESSAELSESINSMFRWYREAGKCYAYMTDVSNQNLTYLPKSVWFTRGWTLQELVAPKDMVFLANDWSDVGSRQDLASEISRTTNIDIALLFGKKSLEDFCVSKRMSWAAKRETTRAEDRAYCLMGIFNVNMPLLYGEGENAFIRLQEEMMKDSSDETLFAWERDGVSEEKPCGLLAPSPDCFAKSADIVPYTLSQGGLPFTLTNRGIRMQSPLVPPGSSTTTLILQCMANSALVGIGIKARKSTAASDDFVRITSTLLRDIPSSFLLDASLDTTYIAKSVVAASAGISGLQGRARVATSDNELHVHLIHRKIQPRGHFKKIVLFFDDTQTPYDKDGNASNLNALHHMLDRADGSQVAFYKSWERGMTLERIVMDGYKFLMEFYQTGDEISLFSFGRGCHVVSALCELLDYMGIVFDSYRPVADDIWETLSSFRRKYEGELGYELRKKEMQQIKESVAREPGRVQFIGLFDAVYIQPQQGEDSTAKIALSSRIVRHAVAIDEKQIRLRPTIVNTYVNQPQSLEQIWFPGTHQDIGGTMSSLSLGHLPLVWMVDEAKKAGLRFEPSVEARHGTSLAPKEIDLRNEDYTRPLTDSEAKERSDLNNDFQAFLSKIEQSPLHSELEFGHGWSPVHVCKQRIKNLFNSRTVRQPAAWEHGQRVIPLDAAVHSSVLRRMRDDPTYQPSNLCIDNPDSLTILNSGDQFRECFVRESTSN